VHEVPQGHGENLNVFQRFAGFGKKALNADDAEKADYRGSERIVSFPF
jgi:hypothetical protein